MFFAAAFLVAVALATEQDCPENSDADLSLVPWIDVEASGFTDGKFEVVLQIDNLIDVDMCWFEDHKDRVETENIEDFKPDERDARADELANETADDKAYCKIPWRSQPEWSVLRPMLKLKDVRDLGLTTDYRYESSVMCKTTETFFVDDKEFTRSLTQEMPFFITIPDEVDVEVDITTRLTQPVEEVEVVADQCTKQFGGLTEAELSAQADQMVLDILAIVDAEKGVDYTITAAGNNLELDVTVVPEVFPQLYTDDRAPGEYYVEATTDAMREQIDALDILDGAECVEIDYTTTFNYFTPEAIITEVTTVAYRDDVAITIVMNTSIERPWRFNYKADNSDLIDDGGVTRTKDCTDGLAKLCDQEWTIQIDGGAICDGTETVDVEMNFSIDLEPNVHPEYSTFNNEQVAEAYPDGLPVTFSIVKEQFTCEVELAAGQITADATMVTYDCPKQSYADLGNDCDFAEENKKQYLWRTWQTVFFQIEVTTTEYLAIESTELVSLNLHQTGDNPRTLDVVETEVDVLLVEDKEGVTDIETPGRQNVADSVYADIRRDHTKFEDMDEAHYERTVEFSILLDLDLFIPFVDLDPVDIRFDANVEITYKDLDERRRRRLLQLNTEPEDRRSIPVSARSRNVLQPSEEDLTIVVIIPHQGSAPHQGPEAPGGHAEAHRTKDVSSSSEEEGLNMTIVIVAVAVVLVLLILAFAAVMFCMWTTHSAKMAQINVQLERQVASNNGVTA